MLAFIAWGAIIGVTAWFIIKMTVLSCEFPYSVILDPFEKYTYLLLGVLLFSVNNFCRSKLTNSNTYCPETVRVE